MYRFIFIFLFASSFAFAQKVNKLSHYQFSNQKMVNYTSVKDQYYSGTCWSFASLSLIESELLRKGKGVFDLSEMYIARYSYLNKVHQFLKYKGGTYFTPGGQYHDVMRVIKQYGIVPETAYTGRVRGEKNHYHADLDTLMEKHVKKMLKEGKTTPSEQDLAYLNEVLDTYLGKVPSSFDYNGKTYTPMSFMKEVLEFEPNDYVEITSYQKYAYYQPFVLDDKYNWTKDKYYNVPLEDLMSIVDDAIKKDFTVCWDGDVTEPYFSFDNAVAYLSDSLENITSDTRQTSYEDGSTQIDHLMHIVGTAQDKFGKRWYILKNSWGTINPYKGLMYVSTPYLQLKTVTIIVHKDAIPKKVRKKLGL